MQCYLETFHHFAQDKSRPGCDHSMPGANAVDARSRLLLGFILLCFGNDKEAANRGYTKVLHTMRGFEQYWSFIYCDTSMPYIS